jgi:hypothetical protein
LYWYRYRSFYAYVSHPRLFRVHAAKSIGNDDFPEAARHIFPKAKIGISSAMQKKKLIRLAGFLIFHKKKQKAFVCFAERTEDPKPSAKRNHGGLGACPQKKSTDLVGFFEDWHFLSHAEKEE